MKKLVFKSVLIAFCAGVFCFGCESKKRDATETAKPQVFNPVETDQDKTATAMTDSSAIMPVEISEIKAERKPMPTAEELKKITPDQQAKRDLNNDAMKAAQMKPEKFVQYMQSRIPNYRGKGNLKAENDMVRIQITEQEMQIEAVNGIHTFPMQ